MTYGFVGLETVAIELGDPFSDDENDFGTYFSMIGVGNSEVRSKNLVFIFFLITI
jgi:predicted membrane chloride channel (bestrophin family)